MMRVQNLAIFNLFSNIINLLRYKLKFRRLERIEGSTLVKGIGGDPRYIKYLEEQCMDDPQLLIELTSVCNFQCDYCNSRNSSRKGRMTDDTFYKILPQIPKLTNHPVRLHMDGEPTMHPKFYDYAKEINNIGYSVALVTNGVKLEPRFTDLDMSIGINLSTSEEELKSRSKLKYERYIESLSQYVSAWNRDCSNQTIALNIYLNADEAKDVEIVDGKIEFAHKLLGDIGLSNILRNDAQQNPVLFFRNAGQGRLTVNLSRIASGGLYPETAKSKQVFMDREYGFCDSLWKRLAILYDGSIQGCCIDLFGTLRISSPEDLDSMSVREIWENNEMLGHYRESFLKGIPPHETCKKCLDRIATREMYTRFHIEWDADLK